VAAQIRNDGRPDVALAVSDEPSVAAGVFTRNIVRAAPVVVAAERLRAGRARALLVNSGCANACTGEAGLEAALRSTAAVAKALGVPEGEVLAASTGVIGTVLPGERIALRADELVAALSASGHESFAAAICTTDRWPKLAEAELAGGRAHLLGIAKGAGMIHPDLGLFEKHATMLAFLFTDATIDRTLLERALIDAVDHTFNACTVDGDTSTNDCVIALASGASRTIVSSAEMSAAMRSVCDRLARSMVADGEGSRHVAEIRVRGLQTTEQARVVCKTIATSMLVKTALNGPDANWGRLLAAAGRSGVPFDPEKARIVIGGVEIVQGGVSLGADAERRATEKMAAHSYVIEIDLGSGPGEFTYLGCDLGHGYIDVNAGYRS
jgi:glutamate N-acetyltransferase/amino-acid N-acetyltransferase